MMQREITAIVLCMFAQAAAAQCVATDATPAAQAAATVATTVRTAAPGTPAQNAQRPAPGLIKSAEAGTRDGAPSMREATGARAQQQDDHPRRGGTAMLLAALALMSGIALRRYGARGQ
jgi:hypothetical protein